jgi:hypothetical protein
MVTARRFGRWLLYALGAVVAVVVLLRVGLGVYLNTSAGKELVARKIGARIGMPVEVTQVRVGLFSSTIGLRVFDPAAPTPSQAEVFAVQTAGADVSLFGFATGKVAPDRIQLHDVELVLHVSADGKVLTTLPKAPAGGAAEALPAIALTDGRITIRQDGRPEFVVRHLNLSIEPNGNRVKLSGTIDDPEWAKWTVSGDVSSEHKTGSVELATADGPLTMDRLESVPFVPASVWRHIRADGRGGMTVRLWTESDADVRYSVQIKPNAAALTIPDADATLTHVTGLITVAGTKVTLSGTKAELAGGTIAIDGDWNWGPEPGVAKFKVAADKLDLKQLPAEWKLKDFDGKLNGKADLTLRIFADGHVEPDGGGEGVITDVKVLGLPGDDIPIHLRKSGKGYEFQQPKKGTSRARPAHVAVACAAPPHEPQPADPKSAQPKNDAPTTLDAAIRLRDVDIAELLKKLNVTFDYKISGKVTAEAAVSVPVSGATSGAAYKFTGKLSSPALTLEGLVIRELAANMAYQNGTFTLTELSGKVDQPGPNAPAPGTFRGTLKAVTSPPGDVTADLTITRIPLGEVLKALPAFKVDVRGTVTGNVSMKAPYAKLSDPTEWGGSGELSSAELVVEGRSAKDIHLSATVAKGVAALKEATVTLESIPVRAEATLGLSGKYPFAATVRTTGTSVTDLRKLVPEARIAAPVEGVLETETVVKGTAAPLTYTATGSIKADKLTLAKSTANHIDARWELTPDKLVVSELKANVFGGTVTGSADVPFAADKAGTFAVAFRDVDAAGSAELVPDFPVRISGKVSGKVAGSLPPAKDGQARVGTLDVDVTAPKLTVQGIPAESLAGKVTVRNKGLEYELEGKTLGGSFEVKGRYPGQKKDAAPNAAAPDRGSIKLRGIELSHLGREAGFRSLAPLGGKLDATFEFESDLSSGSGSIKLLGLRWGEAELATEVTGALVLNDGVLRLTELSGRVAGGDFRARAHVSLHEPGRNSFSVSLDGADAKRVLALGGEEAAGLLDGPVTVVVRGRLGRETQGSGTVSFARGTVSGVPVTDLAVPFEFSTAPGGYGQLTVRDAALSAGTGRARADLTVDWGAETRIEGQVRFTDVPLRAVAPQLKQSGLFGNGRITGRFDLNGSNVRSADDVTGTLVATLNNASVKELPLLQQTTPFLNPAGLVKPFQSGDVRGTLKGGTFRIQRLALANPTAQLFAEGTVTTAGAVNLSVVAHTGTIGPESPALRLFGLRLPAIGPVPLTLIQDVSDFLSNRTIRLTINGTTSNPVVRVNVGALLTDEAVRFLVSRYILPADAAAALGLSAGFGTTKK